LATTVARVDDRRFPHWRPPSPALATAVARLGDRRRPPWRPPSPALATTVSRIGDHRLNAIPAQPHDPGTTAQAETPPP